MSIETKFFRSNRGFIECHAMVHASDASRPFAEQLHEIETDMQRFRTENPALKPVFKRYFLTDIAAQHAELESAISHSDCAVSLVGQPPLDGTQVALWIILKSGVKLSRHGDLYIEDDGVCRHVWATGLQSSEGDLYEKTQRLFAGYAAQLQSLGLHFSDDCIRTWIFVRDIDRRYREVVRARRDFFHTVGLTENTHYIASTGIEGLGTVPASGVMMDVYAVGGLKAGRQHYLHAPSHLNPTHEYGVTFERGVAIDYDDRRHIFISGTASINNRGEIMHEGDIRGQTLRMLENIERLLSEANVGFRDVMSMIVYLRNASDCEMVKSIFDERFPAIPKALTLAPICRPGWLVETECIAIASLQ